MTDQKELDRQRGINARLLLETPLLVEAFEETRKEYLAAWEKTPVRDHEGREKLWLMVRTLDKVRGHLLTVMEGGKLAEHDLADLQEKGKLRRLFG